jgi:hypothetical protein
MGTDPEYRVGTVNCADRLVKEDFIRAGRVQLLPFGVVTDVGKSSIPFE